MKMGMICERNAELFQNHFSSFAVLGTLVVRDWADGNIVLKWIALRTFLKHCLSIVYLC